MFFRSKKNWFFITFLLFAARSVFAAEVLLDYSLVEIHTPAPVAVKGAKAEKETRIASKKKVVLGDGFFSVKEGKFERIYDFKNRRVYYLDHRTKTRTDISLFADPAFRIAEFQNRLSMDDAVKKAGGQPLEDLFSLESIFGIESDLLKVDLKEDGSKKGKTVFLEGEKIRSEIFWSEKKEALAPEMFTKFLIYDNSLHPIVRKKISASHQIPDVIRNQLQSAGATDEFVLTLNSFKTREDQGFEIPTKYAISKRRPGAVSSAEPLAQLMRSVSSEKNKITKHERGWFLDKAYAAQAKKNYLDSALFILEYGLQSGDRQTTTQEMQRLSVYQREDAELDRFFRSLGISGKEQATRAVEELQKIDRKNLSRAHMLDILIANQQSVLGKNSESEKRIISALKVNPYIAGAYKDLGDLFYEEFDMVSAWVCWDFARTQAPGHFMLMPISEYEAGLAKDFPDFF